MKIDRIEARRIAELAHLEFDDAGLDRMAGEMTKILNYIDQLSAVDVEGFPERAAGEATPMRDDVPHDCLPSDGVEANAPAWSDGFFVVPKVIGGES
jgi:aspartyl-tRNA(Asn)/glutamyl-tRNA(Gln) amidotransferase subunit C